MNQNTSNQDEPLDARGDAAVEASDAPETDQLRAELEAARDQVLRGQAEVRQPAAVARSVARS
jgi:hypothetical protein